MAKINLLPWRAERRAARQKEFYAMLGFAAVGGVVLSLLLWFYYGQLISGEHRRIDFLNGEITKVDAQIKEIEELDKKKGRLLARKKVIEQLQANRSQMVHLFDSLVRTIPDGVILTNIKQEGDLLTLEGSAQSNARVSTYMRNLETSGWMTKPDLAIIEAKDNSKPGQSVPVSRALPYQFSLQVRLANPNADADGDGKPDAPVPAPAASPATTAPAAPATPAAAPAPAQPAPETQTRPAS
ncbi:PilN domain-containing protein [Pseudoxanthomonas sangjuensis]|uniref:PilN domain-containing protein n=1 Tax=Pseudoxanthomonas sangjuensis TaxID=1503750 RepID=UPI001391B8C0|nr:PilN domain-containing protein [Pseudoxanthomonas sangjuensis]KAF1709152.1 fimbrial protein [Pseudoxanthomonas sangjuensis]